MLYAYASLSSDRVSNDKLRIQEMGLGGGGGGGAGGRGRAIGLTETRPVASESALCWD